MKKTTLLLAALLFTGAACRPKAAENPPANPTDLKKLTSQPVKSAQPSDTPLPRGEMVELPPTFSAPERTSAVDGMPQVYVPAGTLHMGGLDIHAENDELPSHTVKLDAFWVDKLEVTNGMYMLCVQAGACSPLHDRSSRKRPSYFDNPEFKDYPVVHVTWGDAQTYCTWAGRRLPTEAEWERAARGDDFRTYPWGDEPPTGIYANFNWLVGDTSRVGSYAAGASPFGVLDMAGNVWEWVSDIYDAAYYQIAAQPDPTGPPQTRSNRQRVVRGGSFQDTDVDIRVSNRGFELGSDPAAHANTAALTGRDSAKIGFRCVSDN